MQGSAEGVVPAGIASREGLNVRRARHRRGSWRSRGEQPPHADGPVGSRGGESRRSPRRAEGSLGARRRERSARPRGTVGDRVLPREPAAGVEARGAQPGSRRGRRDDGRRIAAVAPGELGGDPEAARRGYVPARAGPAGDDPQARRRGADAGGADGGGPSDPAGHRAGAHADLRSGVLGAQLRVPPRPQRPPGRESGKGLRGRGLPVGGGHRSGQVLRSCAARHADGAGGSQGGGPAPAPADPEVPDRRDHGGRRQAVQRRGHAPGQPAVAAAGQHHARRSRPGAGGARSSLRALRRRSEGLRAQ